MFRINLKNHLCPQGWFQDFFQGVAETSSGGGRYIFRGWRKSPRGWRNKLRATSFASGFVAFLHNITFLRPIFVDILDTHYKKYLKYIYFFFTFLVRHFPFIQSLVPRDVLGSGGSQPLEMVR